MAEMTHDTRRSVRAQVEGDREGGAILPSGEPARDAAGRTLEEIVREARVATAAEIVAAQEGVRSWGGEKPIPFDDVRVLAGAEGGWTYQVRTTEAVRPPEMTGVQVCLGEGKIRGAVDAVSADGRVLTLSLDRPLPADEREGTLDFDATRILVALDERLAGVEERARSGARTPVLDAWLGLGEIEVGEGVPAHPASALGRLNEGQRGAVARVMGSPAVYTFGPPGTGKTRTLAAAAAELAERQGYRVIVTTQTNTALDAALGAIARAVSPGWRRDGQIARAGFLDAGLEAMGVRRGDWLRPVRDAGGWEDLRLAVEALEAEHEIPGVEGESLRRRMARIRLTLRERWLAAGVMDDPELAETRQAVMDVDALVRRAAARHSDTVPVFGATLSWLALHGDQVGLAEAVLVDEAGMVMLPQVVMAGTFASERVAGFGDPAQLPPVILTTDEDAWRVLGRHPYAQAGVADPAVEDPRRPMLTVQYRMRPPIRRVVSDLFYGGRLEDSEERGEKDEASSLLLIDTSLSGAEVEQVGKSRRNPVHAAMVEDLVRDLGSEGGSVAIISPFSSQSKAIWSRVRGVPEFLARGGVVQTIHRVQGGEFDTVILDLTDTPPRLGMFLDERRNPSLSHLLDVAISRARERLVVLVHAEGFEQAAGWEGTLVSRLLDRLREEGVVVVPGGPSLRRGDDGEWLSVERRRSWSEGDGWSGSDGWESQIDPRSDEEGWDPA